MNIYGQKIDRYGYNHRGEYREGGPNGWGKSLEEKGGVVIGQYNREGYIDGYTYKVDEVGNRYLGMIQYD